MKIRLIFPTRFFRGSVACARQRRSGTTLLEMIATLSLLLVLATTAVRMLREVTEIGTRTSETHHARVAIERLADQVRQDARDAQDITAGASGNNSSSDTSWPLVIRKHEAEIRYDFAAADHQIRRSIHEDSQTVAIDRFTLPAMCEPELKIEEDLVSISLLRSDAVSWTIEAMKP